MSFLPAFNRRAHWMALALTLIYCGPCRNGADEAVAGRFGHGEGS